MARARYLIVVVALLASACAELRSLPELRGKDLRFNPLQATKIFASDGRLLTKLHREDRTLVALDDVPRHTRRAVVAIEDERFYDHEGVDLTAVARAAARNALSGDIKEGGSTITQQLVRNTLLPPRRRREDTIDRKLDEMALARQLERKLTKAEILERYLNTVYFGRGAYGIESAAQTFFEKPAQNLKLSEGALLAGLIRSPTSYDPYQNRQLARRRRDVVVRKMAELGHIDDERAFRITQSSLRTSKPEREFPYSAPYFVDYVTRLLLYDDRFAFLGDTTAQRRRKLLTGGLQVSTTVDLNIQRAAENAIAQVLRYESDPYGALVAIDPRTGHVRAMVGGRHFFARRKKDRFAKLNLAIAAEPGLGRSSGENRAPGTGRQAGSAFKPFALATAIDEGVPLSKTYRASSCMTFAGANAGGDWRVCNYEESAFGPVSLLRATINSINVVYAQLILDVGAEDVAEAARRMGIRTPLSGVPSAALGTNSVNALGMASAYGTLATNGVHHTPVAITKVADAKGQTLYHDRSGPERVLDSATAYLTTTALQSVMTEGTGTAAQIGRPAAGKTGTAQEYRDAWFAGYVPQLVTAVWVGYPEASIEMKTSCGTSDPSVCRPTRITVFGGSWPAQIWRLFMSQALAGVPVDDFDIPSGAYVKVAVDVRTGCRATTGTPDEFIEVERFVIGTQPKNICPFRGGQRQPNQEQKETTSEKKGSDDNASEGEGEEEATGNEKPGRGKPPGRGKKDGD